MSVGGWAGGGKFAAVELVAKKAKAGTESVCTYYTRLTVRH